MRVKILHSIVQGLAGDVIDLDDEIAQKYNKAKYTEAVPSNTPIKKTVIPAIDDKTDNNKT